MAAFDIQELRNLMSYDELEFDKLGDRKTALFIITSDTDSTFDFVTAVCCSQLFNVLCTKADDEYNGSLPVHVQFLLDEFANIKIPKSCFMLVFHPVFKESVTSYGVEGKNMTIV